MTSGSGQAGTDAALEALAVRVAETVERTQAAAAGIASRRLDVRPGYGIDDDSLDDDPMPIPSTWHAEAARTRESALSEEFKAAALGFVLGMMVVVPIVLLVTGRGPDVSRVIDRAVGAVTAIVLPATGTAAARIGEEPAYLHAGSVPAEADMAPAAVLAPTGGAPEPGSSLPEPERLAESLAVGPLPASSVAESRRARADAELVAMEARSLIAQGEIAAARTLIEGARQTADGQLLFMLAETFDPNVLAAWGELDAQPDIDKARGIYMLSLLAGVEKARGRLEALQ